MKRTAKKMISLLLVGMMTVSMLSGCSSKNNGNGSDSAATKTPETTDNSGNSTEGEAGNNAAAIDTSKVETFTVFLHGSAASGFNWDNPVAEEITKKTGVKLQADIALDDPNQKLALMQASGQYDDIILNVDNSLDTMKGLGTVVKLDDLLDQYGSNIKSFYGDMLDRIRMEDKERGIYSFGVGAGKAPDIVPGQYWGVGFNVQNQALKDQGYPQIKTPEDFENVIKTELAKQPLTADGQKRYGLSLITADNWRYNFSILQPANLVNGISLDGDYYLNPETNKVELALQQPYMKEYIRWYNKMYNEGLIDPESFTQNYDTYLSKIATGRVIGVIDGYWQFGNANSQLRNNNQGDLAYMPFTPLTDPANMTWKGDQAGNVAQSGGFSISTSCKNPAKIVNFFNYLASEEGQILTEWGIEGVNYTVDADGNRVRNPEDVKADAKDSSAFMLKTGVKLYARDYNEWLHQPFGYKTANGQLLSTDALGNAADAFTQDEKDTLAKYGYQYFTDAFVSPSKLPIRPYGQLETLSMGSDEDIAVVKKNFDDSKLTNLANAIMCKPEEFDGVWDKYMSDLKDMGVDKLVTVMNQSLDTRKELWNVK